MELTISHPGLIIFLVGMTTGINILVLVDDITDWLYQKKIKKQNQRKEV